MPPKKQELPEETQELPEETPASRVPMQHEQDAGDSLLSIGETVYAVTAGTVLVAPEHVDAARIAGFQVVG